MTSNSKKIKTIIQKSIAEMLMESDYENVCLWAAKEGNISILRQAHQQGKTLKGACSAAAQKGSLECLKYAHENGGAWDSTTCSNAAESGSLECLKYAHENGCPWGEETCINAAFNGHLECLKYAHQNGCPISRVDICAEMRVYGLREPPNQQDECMQYLHENGCFITEFCETDQCKDYLPSQEELREGVLCEYCIYTKNRRLVEQQEALKIIMMDKLKTLFRWPVDYFNQKAIYFNLFENSWDKNASRFLQKI